MHERLERAGHLVVAPDVVVALRDLELEGREHVRGRPLVQVEHILFEPRLRAFGGAETVVGLTQRFKLIPEKRGLYVQPQADAARSNVLSFTPPVPSYVYGW